jgi:hypothetical protein
MRLVCLLAVLLTGCHGQVIDALEQRQVQSCVWWTTPILGTRGVSATGGLPLATCLAVPCQLHP